MSIYSKKSNVNGGLVNTTMVSITGTETSVTKGNIRNALQEKGIDQEDMIADLSNVVSLNISLMSRMYSMFTDTQKNKLSVEDRALIETTFSTFATTDTTADVKLAAEGTTMIEKIFTRWAIIRDTVLQFKVF